MKTLIIAEAGVNHNGNFDLAKKLVDKAVEGGADIVKFQTCKAENVISRYADKAEYQKVTTGEADSQLDMVRKLMLTYEEYGLLKEYCDEKGIFGFNAEQFIDYYQRTNWTLKGGQKIKDWKACARTWIHNDHERREREKNLEKDLEGLPF